MNLFGYDQIEEAFGCLEKVVSFYLLSPILFLANQVLGFVALKLVKSSFFSIDGIKKNFTASQPTKIKFLISANSPADVNAPASVSTNTLIFIGSDEQRQFSLI